MSTDSRPLCKKGRWTTPSTVPETQSFQIADNTYGAKPGPVRTLHSQYRTATISTDIEGNALPVPIVVSPEDLEEMGIIPEETDSIEYRFDKNQLIFRSADHG